MPCNFCFQPNEMHVHDPFVCGVMPRVLQWVDKNRIADLQTLLLKIEAQCCSVDPRVYEDYCCFWMFSCDENIESLLRGEPQPPFASFFATYARLLI
jgi:hypothetical protein